MKIFLVPPNPEDRESVIGFLDQGSSYIGKASHYQFLTQMQGLGYSGCSLLVFATGMMQFCFNYGCFWAPFLLIFIGFYVILYSHRCAKLLELFHQRHPENLTEDMLAGAEPTSVSVCESE